MDSKREGGRDKQGSYVSVTWCRKARERERERERETERERERDVWSTIG